MATDGSPRRTLRAQLIVLALATLLPMLAFASVLIAWSVQDHRDAVERGAVETARALRTAVDRELESTITSLQVLTTHEVFSRGAAVEMHAALRTVLPTQPDWANIVVAVPEGRQVVNLLRPPGDTLPPIHDVPTFEEVIRSRRPVIGNVMLRPVLGQHVVSVRVPVIRGQAVKYVLSAVIPARRFGTILDAQRLPRDWVGSIVDAQNRHIVRSRAHDRFVGQPLSSFLLEALSRAAEGWIPARTLEGQSIYAAFSRSDRTGWTVALGVPSEAVNLAFSRSLIGFGVSLVLAAGIAIGIAIFVSRRVAAPLAALADAAPGIVTGQRVTLPPADTAEVEVLARALTEAAAVRAQTESELGRTSRLLQAVFDGTSDAVFVKDAAGRYLMMNAAGARLLGRSVEDVVGSTDADLFAPDSARYIAEQDRGIVESGETRTFENEVRATATDSVRTFLSMKAPYRDAGGRIIGVIGVTRDISARKRVEAERVRALEREQAARTEAEMANRAKDEFLAMLSHELRTPLNAVYGWARMLRRGGLDAATQARAIEVIERNANAQVQMIEDLLDISRIITGKMRLEIRPIDLPAVVSEAVDSLRPAADARGLRLHTTFDPHVPSMVGDPDRLQQVVWNLVSNAVKFTPRDGRVDVTLRRVGSDVEIAVADTGEGITDDMLPFVFDRFRQGDSTSTREHGGLGLGLALVRHLTELHGGSVTAASAGRDLGATFVVKLPIVAPRSATEPERASSVRVLIVDDHTDTLDDVLPELQRTGAAARVVTSADAGVDLLRTWRPDVILCGLEISDDGGIAFLRRVQAVERETGHRFPAVALTASTGGNERLRTLSVGFAMHLPKPVDPRELIAVIRALTRRR
jgi:PAS domain S-box-containing protein